MELTVEKARLLYGEHGAAHDFSHVLRVLRLAERIAEAEGADVSVVRTAALLHDVGVGVDRARHHLVGARLATELLAGEPEAFVTAVSHCIVAHRFRYPPEPATLEAKCLSDADNLDAIGAIGIARAFVYAGEHGSPLWTVPVAQAEAEATPTAIAYTPVHEFVFKLRRVKDRLYTDVARRIAEERHRYMVAFFQRLDQEVAGKI